jgi:hypothetical protein
MDERKHQPARRVIIGTNAGGASTVVSDGPGPETQLDNGILLQEIWQQRNLPAQIDDEPEPGWTLGPHAPTEGAVVRLLTVPAGHNTGEQTPQLHSDPSLHVITLLDGELDFVLESGQVTLLPGETIVLRDSMHDMSNRQTRPARTVYTSFPLTQGPSSA